MTACLSGGCQCGTAPEYGLIAAVVGSVIAVGFGTYGTALKAALEALRV